MTSPTPSPISDQAASYTHLAISWTKPAMETVEADAAGRGFNVFYAVDIDLDGQQVCLSYDEFKSRIFGISTAPTTGSAPETIRFDFINADGNEDSKVISHDEMRERYASMYLSAHSNFAAPASPAASVPHPSIARAIAQEERACRAEDALIDLVNQIRKSNPVDDHGHDLKMNRAYLEAEKLLDAVALLAASMGGGEK